MTRPQRLYVIAANVAIVGLAFYAADREGVGIAVIVISAVVGFIGWRVKG